MTKPINLAVLTSGTGTTLQNLIDRIEDGTLNARIEIVVSSIDKDTDSNDFHRGSRPVCHVDRKDYTSDAIFSYAINHSCLADFHVDLVVLAGWKYLYLSEPDQIAPAINIHPSLLPAFGGKGMYGLNVHRAVLDAGCKVTGCTVHWVDDKYDHGKIIEQVGVDIGTANTPERLQQVVQILEQGLLPRVINGIADGEINDD